MDNNNFIPPVVNQRRSGLPNISGKIIMIVVGLALALIIGVALMFLARGNNPTDRLDQLNARMTALQSVVAVGSNRAQSSDLRKVVSDASILLVNDTKTISETTALAGASGQNKEIMAAENETKLIEQLETAAINGQFDRVFVPELIEKYEATIRLLTVVGGGTNSPSLRAAATTAKTNCESILKQLQALTI